jgi:hypothetical protein
VSGLQGECTLTQDEKITEARKHIQYLYPHLSEMTDNESAFVRRFEGLFRRFGSATFLSNKQLFWMRDLVQKY